MIESEIMGWILFGFLGGIPIGLCVGIILERIR